MTTATLAPKPIRKNRNRKSTTKTMTEHVTREQPPASNASLNTITKVQSHLPEYQLIDRNALWEDFTNRMKINNYEISEAMRQLKDVVHQTHKFALPYVDKAVNYVKSKQQ